MTTQSTERSANDSGTPYIGAVSIPSLHPGDTPPDFIVTNITNGAFEIVFTDKDGKPLASAGNPIPACALDVNQAPLPPCHLAMRLTPNKAYFYFSGTIADEIKLGSYTFYVRARNQAGWGNTVECTMKIIAKSS